MSDYVRLHMLYEEGGVYVDWDVELLKPLDDMLRYDAFFGMENEETIQSGFFGAVKGHPLIKENMEFMQADFNKFQGTRISKLAPAHFTDIISSYGTFPGMLQGLENVRIFDIRHSAPIGWKHVGELMRMKRHGVSESEYISCLHKAFPFSDDTYAVHWYTASWMVPRGGKGWRILMKKIMFSITLPIYGRIDLYLFKQRY